ncbi:MAG TPA: peptidyl-prolyl cis-trans isomerase [bacterium]|nr:peptidyl-prolyl cis-trans isomerase [bacterium]
MRSRGLIIVAGIVLGLAVGCANTDNKAVARVGKDVITVKMVKDQYLAISPSARPDLKTIEDRTGFAKDIISKHILLLEARKLGLDRSPDVAKHRQQAINSKAWQALYQEEVRSKVNVTDKDLQDLYAKQKVNYHVGWIFVRSKTLADDLERRIKNGEDFAKLAAVYSIDNSREQGGDLGFRNLGMMPASIEDKVAAMSPGQISDVVPYDTYYVIIKLFETKEVQPQPFDQVKTGLESMVRTSRENALQRQLAADIRKTYNLTFNEATVDMVVAKTTALYKSPDVPLGKIPEFSDEEKGRELAKWKGGVWKVEDYAAAIKSLRDYMRPGPGADRECVESIVGDYITGLIWGAEIKSKGYDVRPEAVEAGQRAMEEDVVTTLHDQLVKDVKPDSSKITSFYEENKAKLMTGPGVRISIIMTASEDEAKAAYDQIKAGAAFEAVAKQRSTDAATAPLGGVLPQPLYKQDLEQFPDLEGVLDNLAVGACSNPMQIPVGFGTEGWMLVKLNARLEPRQLQLAEIKDYLSSQVLQMEQDKVFGDWLKAKTDEYKVEIYPDGLSAIDFDKLKTQGS